jgi:transcriptional regulator with XRE-family HTH domain
VNEFDAIEKAAKTTFAKRIKTALEDKGCDTLVKKAAFLGVSDDQIRNYEKGRSFPPAAQLVYFSRCLGCSVDYLTDETVTVKTPDTGVKAVTQATGLSEESAKLLVSMKKLFPKELAALDALLVSCMDRDLKRYQYNAIGGMITANAEYFRIVNETETKLIADGEAKEDPTARNVARIKVMDSTMNLLENGPDAARLCSIYRKNLERLETESNKKGGSDNGSGDE